MEPIKEDETPSTGSLEDNSNVPGAVSFDSSNDSSIEPSMSPEIESSSAAEPVIESTTMGPDVKMEPPVDEIPIDAAPLVDESPNEMSAPSVPVPESLAENPPFLQSTPAFIAPTEVTSQLKQAINFRKTLKHKNRSDYDRLSDSEKMVAKKKIVDNLIHVLRSSTQKTTYKNHKKSILKLRHTLNKHLDYIEKKKKVKSLKKDKMPKTFEKYNRSKSIR